MHSNPYKKKKKKKEESHASLQRSKNKFLKVEIHQHEKCWPIQQLILKVLL